MCKLSGASMATSTPMATFKKDCCVRGCHVYGRVWDAVIDEHLTCRRETTNESDRYAVAVLKDGNVKGHLPRKVSRICSLFLRRGGIISCEVTGTRRYSADLLQGGLEIPCKLLFTLKAREVDKVQTLFKL